MISVLLRKIPHTHLATLLLLWAQNVDNIRYSESVNISTRPVYACKISPCCFKRRDTNPWHVYLIKKNCQPSLLHLDSISIHFDKTKLINHVVSSYIIKHQKRFSFKHVFCPRGQRWFSQDSPLRETLWRE